MFIDFFIFAEGFPKANLNLFLEHRLELDYLFVPKAQNWIKETGKICSDCRQEEIHPRLWSALFISSPHDILQGLAPAWPTMVGYELCRQNNCARFDLLGFGVVWGVRREAVDQNNRVVLDYKQPACVAHKTLNRVLCK